MSIEGPQNPVRRGRFAAPAPIVVTPAPVVVTPAPVVVTHAPVVSAAPTVVAPALAAPVTSAPVRRGRFAINIETTPVTTSVAPTTAVDVTHAPVVVTPEPVVVTPTPVVVTPTPVVVTPAPVVVTPAPVESVITTPARRGRFAVNIETTPITMSVAPTTAVVVAPVTPAPVVVTPVKQPITPAPIKQPISDLNSEVKKAIEAKLARTLPAQPTKKVSDTLPPVPKRSPLIQRKGPPPLPPRDIKSLTTTTTVTVPVTTTVAPAVDGIPPPPPPMPKVAPVVKSAVAIDDASRPTFKITGNDFLAGKAGLKKTVTRESAPAIAKAPAVSVASQPSITPMLAVQVARAPGLPKTPVSGLSFMEELQKAQNARKIVK